MNRSGTAANLVPAHPGNLSAVTHGVYSGRVLGPRAREVADALMELPHVAGIDVVAAEEIGSLVARLEAVDRDLDERGHIGRNGARSLLDHKVKLSRELRAWLREICGTPRARADYARVLSDGGLAAEIARRRTAADDGA